MKLADLDFAPLAGRPRSMRCGTFLALGAWCFIAFLFTSAAFAAPEAHILRIDPRAGLKDGRPVVTTVVEVAEFKRPVDALEACAHVPPSATLSCWSNQLEKSGALWQPFPFPEQNARLSVKVAGEDRAARFMDKTEWGKAQSEPSVGTAWLVAIDASFGMDRRFEDERRIAHELIEEMQPNDLMDIVFFDGVDSIRDTKWKTFKQRAELGETLNESKSPSSVRGRDRALLPTLRRITRDGFGSFGSADSDDSAPLHQAMVLMSGGPGKGDPESDTSSAESMRHYLDRGRFSVDGSSLPKMPLPMVSIWLPSPSTPGEDVAHDDEAQVMQSLANPELGGLFDIVQEGQGDAKAKTIIGLVRAHFDAMWLVHWTVGCVNPSVEQTFDLSFENTHPAIASDGTFRDGAIGIDPSRWPLDVDVAKTEKASQDSPLYPGGSVTIYGNFCWDNEKQRAEGYFLPAGVQLEPASKGSTPDGAKKLMEPFLSAHLVGAAVATGDGYVTFAVPDDPKLLDTSPDGTIARVVVYDSATRRASAVDPSGVLTLHATKKPIPVALVAGLAGLTIVFAILVVVLVRSSSKKPGPPAPGAGYPTPGSYGEPDTADPLAATAAAPAMVLGLMRPGAPGMTPYGQGYPAGPVVTLRGAAGQFNVLTGTEVRVGRDPAQCALYLAEPRVSAVHATIKFESGMLLVRDDGSNNGTWLFGTRIAPRIWTPVPAGAALRFGPLDFTVHIEGHADR